MRSISRKRFNAYVDFTRNPQIFNYAKAAGWYENDSKTLFGVILLDYTDMNYTSIILGRDETRRICCIDLKVSFKDIDACKVVYKTYYHSSA